MEGVGAAGFVAAAREQPRCGLQRDKFSINRDLVTRLDVDGLSTPSASAFTSIDALSVLTSTGADHRFDRITNFDEYRRYSVRLQYPHRGSPAQHQPKNAFADAAGASIEGLEGGGGGEAGAAFGGCFVRFRAAFDGDELSADRDLVTRFDVKGSQRRPLRRSLPSTPYRY